MSASLLAFASRRGYVALLASALALVVALGPTPACAVGSINATLDKSQVTVGEPFTYTVTLIIPQGAQADLPAEKARLPLFEVRDYRPTQVPLQDGSTQITLQYTLVCFDTGLQGLKEFRVPVRPVGGPPEKYLAPPLQIKVASVLPEKGQVEPKGFYGPIMLKAWWADLLLPAGLAYLLFALVAVVISLLMRRRKQVASVESEVLLEPDQAAVAALDRLEREDLVACGQFLVFYQRLDEVLRAWLQARFGIPAMERTRLGISYFLRVRREADEWRTEYLALLRAGDAVKYAKQTPADDEARAHLEQARTVLALATKPEPDPEPPTTDAQAVGRP